MPKAVQYKTNSIVYFAGDVDDKVFLLQKGRMALTSTDIETGKQITEYIREGEFFGVKSALGHFPREESAMVIADSIVLAFSTAEFEAFAQTNTRIIMKMLKVFSNQLRHIHRQIESRLDSKEETNPDDGLFSVAKCFYNSQQYRAAGEVAVRYLQLYPSGKHVQEVKDIAKAPKPPRPPDDHLEITRAEDRQRTAPDGRTGRQRPNLALTLAEGLAGQGKWEEAYKQYHSVIELGETPVVGKAYVGAGQCLYEQEEHVRCVQLLSGYISQYPKSGQMADVLMYMGLCYQKMDQPDKAKAFFNKALTMAGPLLAPKVRELLESCGG